MNLVRPIVQQTGGIVRGTLRLYGRVASGLLSTGIGAVQSVLQMRSKPDAQTDDVTAAPRVETESRKTPARTRAESPARARRTGAPSRAAGARKTTPGARRSEQRGATAEPSPREAAAAGEGRRPAPFGSKDPSTEAGPSQ